MEQKKYPMLFTPIQIRNTVFKNRLFSGPSMICQTTPWGEYTERMISYFESKAKGGAAAVTVGESAVDEDRAAAFPRHSAITPNTLPMLFEMATAIRSAGAVPSIELNHNGFTCPPEAIGGKNPIGPVSFLREDGVQVEGMDEDMMKEVAGNFARSAAMVKQAGFEMVTIHGGHGWLLDQFLSPLFNTRTDAYGGSLENRAKFPIMVIQAVREAVGRNFIIEYRMSGSECLEGGLDISEACEFAKRIDGLVDIIHVSAGIDHMDELCVRTIPTIFLPRNLNVEYAAAIKQCVSTPVAVVGAIDSPEDAEKILEEGKADIIVMTRGLIADPEFPKKARAGQTEAIRPCLRCCDCMAGIHEGPTFSCAVNPIVSRERWAAARVGAPKTKKKVLVCGGGPAGMEAAAVAALRGHEVILAEKNAVLGGWLWFTDYDPLKVDLKRLKDYLIHRVETSGAEIRLNTEVTPELVRTIQPDAILIAEGSEPIVPNIPGIHSENIMHASEVYRHADRLGKHVVLVGGGLVGCEVAVYLADLGHSVDVVEMLDEVAVDSNWMHKEGLMQYIADKPIRMLTSTRCVSMCDNGVQVADAEGKESFLAADSVIYALGNRSRFVLAESLSDMADEVVLIGDARAAGKCKQALRDALFAAENL